MIVRDATPEDWPAIWAFVAQIVQAGDTFTYDPAMTEAQAKAIWLVDPPDRTVVAEPGRTGPGRPTTQPPRARRARGQRQLHGRSGPLGRGGRPGALRGGLDWAKRQGYRAMQFNAVAESNTRAIALYESLGFETVGTVPEAFEHPTLGYVALCVM